MGTKKRISLETFRKINQELSSEMVLAVMGALHDNFPCSQNVFRMIQNFIDNRPEPTDNELKVPEEKKEDDQPVRKRGIISKKTSSLLASPNIIRNFKRNSGKSDELKENEKNREKNANSAKKEIRVNNLKQGLKRNTDIGLAANGDLPIGAANNDDGDT